MARLRWFPHPIFSAVVFLFWLLLVNELSILQVIAAFLIALVIPRVTYRFWPEHPQVQRPLKILEYVAIVLGDILVANLEVARLILTPRVKLRPGFIELPLKIDDPFAITILAATVSLTPGTVSTDVDRRRRRLLVHALTVDDGQALARYIEERYERRLMEIFK